MDEYFDGEAIFKGISKSRALRKHVVKQVAQWVRDHHLGGESHRVKYKVLLERKGEGHEVFCQTEIMDEATRDVWVSVDSGMTPQEALHRCLHQVKNSGLGFRYEQSTISA